MADGIGDLKLMKALRAPGSVGGRIMRKDRISGAEISYLLGFEDPNSFFRAFHSWTGETPEQARLAMQASS